MAAAVAMGTARPWHVGAKRKWSGQGLGQSKRRYSDQGFAFERRRLGEQSRERSVPKTVPRAPYNDNSFLMRVRRAGGLESSGEGTTSFMSAFEDSAYGDKFNTYEDFVDREDYGYGSMTGLIRLRRGERSSGCSAVEGGGGDSNVFEERASVPCCADSAEQMEERLERGVSRFEMTGPAVPELVVARQDIHIQFLEDENLILRDRLFLIQQELNELRRALQGRENCIDESDESDD